MAIHQFFILGSTRIYAALGEEVLFLRRGIMEKYGQNVKKPAALKGMFANFANF